MTTLLEQAVQVAKSLPVYRQDEIGEMILAIFEYEPHLPSIVLDQHTRPQRRSTSRLKLADADLKTTSHRRMR
jgi:hypothetical protein